MKIGHSYSKMNLIPSGRASDKVVEGCLVLEGGAFRGLYTQGLLDSWMQNDMNIRTVMGVSAGALSAVAYVSGQIGRSARANLGYRHDTNYIGVDALRRAHSLINIDFLIKDFDRIEPLDLERFNSPSRRLVAVATNCDTGRPEFFEKDNCSDMMAALKASASMPYISPMVKVDGIPCLDGGCSCAIPFRRAIEQGYEKIVVIKTRDRSFRIANAATGSVARKVYRRHQEFALALDEADVRYNRDLDELDRLEEEGRLLIVQPSEPVNIRRVEGDMEKLGKLYWLGYDDGLKSLERVSSYLGT